MQICWSEPIPFERDLVKSNVPRSAGVYKIRQDSPYPRYVGTTTVVKIGMSKRDLRAEIDNHFQRHAAANRLARIRKRQGVRVSVTFALCAEPGKAEDLLLRDFEDEHWDLPVLNAHRGYGRDEDRKYR